MSALEVGRINVAARARRRGAGGVRQRDSLCAAAHRLRQADRAASGGAVDCSPIWARGSQAARLMVENAAPKKDAGERCDVEAGMAKLFASEACAKMTLDAMRVLGGYGYMARVPGRAFLSRRAADDDRRGNQRDSGAGDRTRPARAQSHLTLLQANFAKYSLVFWFATILLRSCHLQLFRRETATKLLVFLWFASCFISFSRMTGSGRRGPESAAASGGVVVDGCVDVERGECVVRLWRW